MILKKITKQRKAKQFHYMPRYSNDKKFDLIYRSIGSMRYAESYTSRKFDDKKKFTATDKIDDDVEKNTEKRIEFERSIYRKNYNSSGTVVLIIAGLIILVLAMLGFDLTFLSN